MQTKLNPQTRNNNSQNLMFIGNIYYWTSLVCEQKTCLIIACFGNQMATKIRTICLVFRTKVDIKKPDSFSIDQVLNDV